MVSNETLRMDVNGFSVTTEYQHISSRPEYIYRIQGVSLLPKDLFFKRFMMKADEKVDTRKSSISYPFSADDSDSHVTRQAEYIDFRQFTGIATGAVSTVFKKVRAHKTAKDNLRMIHRSLRFNSDQTKTTSVLSRLRRNDTLGDVDTYHSETTNAKEKDVIIEHDKIRVVRSYQPIIGKSVFADYMLEAKRLSDCRSLLQRKNDAIRVVLLGKAGSGKSELGDTLLGEKRFSKFRNLQDWIDWTESRSVQAENRRFGRHINIVDTPGIFNTGHSELQVAKAIRKCILLTEPGPHAIILVVKASRITKEDIEVFKTYTDMFGESMLEYTIVVFTHFDHWKQIEGKTKEDAKEEFVRSFPETLNNVIHKIKDRYIMLDTKGTDVEYETKALMFGIDQMVKDNQNRFYSCEHLICANTTELRAERKATDENRRQNKRKNGRQNTRRKLQKNIKRARPSFESETDASMIPHFRRSYNGLV